MLVHTMEWSQSSEARGGQNTVDLDKVAASLIAEVNAARRQSPTDGKSRFSDVVKPGGVPPNGQDKIESATKQSHDSDIIEFGGRKIQVLGVPKPGDAPVKLWTGHTFAIAKDGTQVLASEDGKYTLTVTPNGTIVPKGTEIVEQQTYKVMGSTFVKLTLADGTQLSVTDGALCGVQKADKHVWIYDPNAKLPGQVQF